MRIVQEQAVIVGSLAWEIAAKVHGLVIVNNEDVAITGISKTVINDLVIQFEKVFGTFADDVCKHAVSDLLPELPTEDIPTTLK